MPRKRIFQTVMLGWMLGVFMLALYYGSRPFDTGSFVATGSKTELVELKGKNRYITKEDKFMWDLSRALFFGSISAGFLYSALRLYGPEVLRRKIESLESNLKK